MLSHSLVELGDNVGGARSPPLRRVAASVRRCGGAGLPPRRNHSGRHAFGAMASPEEESPQYPADDVEREAAGDTAAHSEGNRPVGAYDFAKKCYVRHDGERPVRQALDGDARHCRAVGGDEVPEVAGHQELYRVARGVLQRMHPETD